LDNDDVVDNPDGITRFAVGIFKVLEGAKDLQQNILNVGREDSWIIPFCNGIRMLMQELVEVNFYWKEVKGACLT